MFGLPETFLQLAFVEEFIAAYRWVWPLSEVLHFVGLTLLVSIVAIYDIRLLGVADRIPISSLQRLIPLAVVGFFLCVCTGLIFVTGLWANVKTHPMEALVYDRFLQAKLLFIAFAGINLLALYKTGMADKVESLKPGEEAPTLAKFIAGSSLFLWVGVIYWGRLIPWGL